MLTDRNIKIDYAKVFSILPTIMGFPMNFYRNKWYASRKMDGSFSQRPDKLVCRMVKDGIQILEQGGESLTLFNWMLKYGGCQDRFSAKLRLLNMAAAVLVTPKYEEEKAVPDRFVPIDYLNRSYERRIQKHDNFTKFMWSIFGESKAENTLRKYKVGSNWQQIYKTKSYAEATQFWYINRNNEICHDKSILYKEDGHRDHDFGGGRFYRKDKGYNGRCFFGEHLLKSRREGEKVYIVESEKTAIIASAYFNKGIWLATGGKCYFRKTHTSPDWVLISDFDAWDYWNSLAWGLNCPKWWESYPGYVPGEHDDIGDLIINFLIKRDGR